MIVGGAGAGVGGSSGRVRRSRHTHTHTHTHTQQLRAHNPILPHLRAAAVADGDDNALVHADLGALGQENAALGLLQRGQRGREGEGKRAARRVVSDTVRLASFPFSLSFLSVFPPSLSGLCLRRQGARRAVAARPQPAREGRRRETRCAKAPQRARSFHPPVAASEWAFPFSPPSLPPLQTHSLVDDALDENAVEEGREPPCNAGLRGGGRR